MADQDGAGRTGAVAPAPFSARSREQARIPAPPPPAWTSAPARWPWWCDPLALAAVALIVAYRRAWPNAWKRRCIHAPTCSEHGLEAIRRHGAVRGGVRAWWRIRHCDASRYLGTAPEERAPAPRPGDA